MPALQTLFDLTQIALIDLSLAADNALVIGMAVAHLPPQSRRRAMLGGVLAATVLRIILALFAAQLLHVSGLTLAGGLLLMWVAWKMLREHRAQKSTQKTSDSVPAESSAKTSRAIINILVADLSMSLDNVLAVAGVARDQKLELILGLVLSVGLMGLAAVPIAELSGRYPKLIWVGIAAVLYTALRMIYDGTLGLELI